MLVATHVPGPPLDEAIAFCWFHEGLTPPYRLERVLPDGSMGLIINLREEPRHIHDPRDHRPVRQYRGAWFSGAHSRFLVIDTAPDASMIGVHFHPGGASACLGMPASELQETVVDLESLWGSFARELRERLLAAPDPASKFALLESALRARWCAASADDRVVRHVLRRLLSDPHQVRIGEVTREIGFTPKRFIRAFTDRVGLPPKRFCRVRRFQRVLGAIQQGRPVAWADVAVSCGYFDQSHFIHDFQEFCGMNPGDYLREEIEYPGFVPVRD